MDNLLCDLTKLEEISKGNQQFVNKMIQLFVEQTPIAILNIKESFNSNDFDNILKLTHRIKPSIETLAIKIMKDDLQKIEENIKNNSSTAETLELILSFETDSEGVINDLKEYLIKKK